MAIESDEELIRNLSVEADSGELSQDDYSVVDSTADGTRKTKLSALSDWIHGRWASFVNALTAKTSFASGDKIAVVNGSTATAMSKDSLLQETAENALGSIHNLTTTATESDLVAGNYIPLDGSAGTKKLPGDCIAPKSVQDNIVASNGRQFSAANGYVIGEVVEKDGLVLQAKENISAGVFDSSKWEALPTLDAERNIDIGINLPLFGKGNTPVVRFISVSENVKSLSLKPTPNPWPIATITGTNPTILDIECYNSSGTSLSTFCHYSNSATIPQTIKGNLPAGTALLKIFIRADSGEKVLLQFLNDFVAETNDKIAQYDSIGSGVSKSITLTGKNLTFAEHTFLVEEGVKKVSVEISPAPWPIDSIGGSNPGILYLYPVFSDGTEGTTLIYASAGNPGTYPYYECALPDGTKKLHLRIRANNNSDVNITLKPLPTGYNFSEEDYIFANQNVTRRNTRIPLALVVGDPHANKDAFISATEAVNGIGNVDFVICVGDMCADHPTADGAYDDYKYLFNMQNNVPVLPVVGNHDIGSTDYIGYYVPTAKSVENVMKPAIDRNFIPSNSGGYYYKDFSSRKLRVIVVNQYELGGIYGDGGKWDRVTYDSSKPDIAFSTAYSQGDIVNIPGWTDYSYQANANVTTPATAPTSWSADIPCWKTRRPDLAGIGQTQAQWIADTLLSTPANYGVVIVTHTYASRYITAQTDRKFCMDGITAPSHTSDTDFLADIVTAFQNGSNYSATVEYALVDPYTVSCNFATKNTGVKFIGFVAGHLHYDAVYEHEINRSLHFIHACASMNSGSSDIRYFTMNGTFHSNFTLIGFDVANSAMNLIKIGNKLTDDGYLRDCERIVNA